MFSTLVSHDLPVHSIMDIVSGVKTALLNDAEQLKPEHQAMHNAFIGIVLVLNVYK